MYYQEFGKVDFSTIITPDEEYKWCYSYQELQNELNNICKNHTLKKVYADLQGYLESLDQGENYYDFSYFGGPVILIFDNTAVELCIHGEGMVQYRAINLSDVKINNTKDFPPDDMGVENNNYFYDLSKQFELSYEEQNVLSVSVDATDCYAFSLESFGFDKKKADSAMEANILPNNIHFQLSNGVDFGIYADVIEYFYIELEKQPPLHTAPIV